ncbi:MAG: CHASE2 domain-containing protein [Proteobacteria bacterium]|nr:CHASE2 domain-containing protein [Pseudomonadota bacterium]NOG59750.1 CHASE2 domain-containing protein [Pseudomonadota bacterium]
MKKFWKKDWFSGLVVTIICLFMTNSQLIKKLEFANYDFAMDQLARNPQQNIAIIAIDDQSIDNLGRWPWPRSLQANMIEKLAQSGAKVIGNSITLSEPQTHLGGKYIDQAIQNLESLSAPGLNDTINILKEGKSELDSDGKLAKAMEKAGNVVMGMQFQLGKPLGKSDKNLPDYVSRNSITVDPKTQSAIYFYPAISATPPIAVLGETTHAMGHLNMWLDSDGGIRSDLLAVDYYGEIIPSLAAMIVASSLNLSSQDIKVSENKKLNLGNLSITLDDIGRIYPFFYQDAQGKTPFSIDSFYDVHVGNIDVNKYKDKIVLIGASAFGVGTSYVTPVSEAMPPAIILANIVASILNQDFIEIPDWARLVEILVFILIALYLMLLLPRLSANMAAAISFVCLILLIGSSQFMLYSGLWLQFMLPTTLLVLAYILLISKRYLVTEKGKIKSDQASAESNKTLGLSYQQQGQLDMALDKFRQCPLDDSMMEPLYNLALDFERKRQFNKASSIYEYMVKHDAKFKDIQDRIKRSNAMQDTFVFGAAGGPKGVNILEDGSIEKPMLGRYQIEKELGKGAMGIVYLGKDPKINRVVAIKTLALSQEFEDDELDEVKERFFREAETAGRLTHPNIVTIYDVGEEHDLAYISMEFLDGHDLMRYTKPDKLLPVKTVLQLVILAAEALSYAHQQKVVHRDIKPANVMLIPASSTIKLTDFGIARITDSSKTKTGMVLGTPSYMSPEQLVGKRIDGRSDLFSLGIMLFQLLTGRLPFIGDSMASLMFAIANEPHPEIIDLRKGLKQATPEISAIINKVLEKTPEKRYQTGEELAKDLRNCLKNIKKN